MKTIVKALVLIALPLTAARSYLPAPELIFASGPYIGVQGGYTYVHDKAKFSGTPPQSRTNSRHAINGGAYLGYGHVFLDGNIPYLGIEAGINYRAKYNKCSVFKDGCLNGTTINARANVSLDVLIGAFYDETRTLLIYGRVGAEGDRFKISGNNIDKTKDKIFLRVGGGLEQRLFSHFYLRADYVFALSNSKISYKIYSSRPYIHTFTLGLDYRL